MAASFVLASLRGSTYGSMYASPLRSLRLRWRARSMEAMNDISRPTSADSPASTIRRTVPGAMPMGITGSRVGSMMC